MLLLERAYHRRHSCMKHYNHYPIKQHKVCTYSYMFGSLLFCIQLVFGLQSENILINSTQKRDDDDNVIINSTLQALDFM